MILNCIVIDDEPLAEQLLASYIEKTPFLHLAGSYSSPVKAMEVNHRNDIDVAFLDIQMPELSGLEFAKILPPNVKIIFTTAFEQFAIDGYKVDAVDYLLKPISYQDFFAAVNRVHDGIQKSRLEQNKHRSVFIKNDYKQVQLDLDDILFIEGEKDYVKIHVTTQDKPIQSLLNMKRIEEALPSPEFIRVHRSHIVHMNKVESLDKLHLIIGKHSIPVSDTYKADVLRFVESHSI